MKKLFFAVLLISCLSCNKEGDILTRSTRSIEINGIKYKFIQVVPADGHNGVWLLIPEDANIKLPQLTSYSTSCGKNCVYMLNCIWIKS